MKKKVIVILGASILSLGLWTALRPVKLTKQNSRNLSAVVADVTETQGKGIILQFYGDKTLYYLSNGTEQGLDVRLLKGQLLNTMVDLTYIDQWSPLNPFSSLKPVASLKLKGKTLYADL